MIHRLRLILLPTVLLVSVVACAKKPDHMKRGEEYASQKKYKEAIVEYRAALKENSRNGAADLALADAYGALGEGGDALREYVRAADLLPQSVDAQLKAGAVLLLAGQFKDAAARGDNVLRVEPKNAAALTLIGNALAGLQNMVGAERRLQQAIDADPKSDVAYASIGALEVAEGHPQAAEAAFKAAIAANPKSVIARVALAQFYQAHGRTAEAESALAEAARIDPHDIRVNAQLSQLYVQTGRARDAETPIKAVVASVPGNDSQLMLADYYVRTNRPAQAVPILEKLAGNTEAYGSAKVRLAALAYTQGRASDGDKTVEEVLKRQPKNRDALLLKSQILLRAKNYDAALPLLKAAAAADPARAAEPTMLQANVYLSRGQLQAARDAYKEALRIAPQSAAIQLALSKLDAAIGDNQDSIDLALSAVRLDPSNLDAHLNLEQRLFAKGDVEGAARELKTLQENFAPTAQVLIESAALDAARKDLKSARAALERALAIDPSSANALEGLIALDLAAQDRAAARSRVEARLRQAPRDGQVWFMAAKLYATSGDRPHEEEALKNTIAFAPSNFRAFTMLGQLYGAQGRIADARHQFELWAEREPQSVGARTMVGLLLEQEHNEAAARKAFEEAIEIAPNAAAVAANNLAWIYTESGEKADEAQRLAGLAASQAPEIADFTDTLGWVYYKADLTASAIPLFQKAIARDPSNPAYHYHLGMAYLKENNDTEAKRSLQRALSLNATFANAADARAALASLQ